MEIINILGHNTDIAFLINQFVADIIDANMTFVRFAFLFFYVKFLQPFPDCKGLGIKIGHSKKLFRSNILQFLFGPVAILVSECWYAAGSWNTGSCHENNLLLFHN